MIKSTYTNTGVHKTQTFFDRFVIASVITLALIALFQIIAQSENPRGTWLREGGVIENAQALLFLFAGFGFLIAMHISQSLKEGPNWRYLPVILWAGLMFFVCGEEISWGQRLFGFETSSIGLFSDNVQNETNLHNLPALNTVKAIYVNNFILLFGFILPLIALYPPVRWLLRVLAFPVAPLASVPIFIGAYLLHSYRIYTFEDFGYMPREYSELLIALGFAWFAWTGANKQDSLFGAR